MDALRSQMFQWTDHISRLPESDAIIGGRSDWAGSDRIQCDLVLALGNSILLFGPIEDYPTALQAFQ